MLSDFNRLSPKRFQIKKMTHDCGNFAVWRDFMWSYERDPVAADFLRQNGLKTLVCSHSAAKFHNISVFDGECALLHRIQSQEAFEFFREDSKDVE